MYESIKKIGKIAPKHSKDIASSRIGIGFEKMDSERIDPSRFYKPLGECGFKWVRIHSGWNRTEKTKGVYDFKWLDEIVDQFLANGVTPWLDLLYGNTLYTHNADNEDAWGFPPVYTEEERAGWRAYISALVAHFKDRVLYYEIWNEPDGGQFWKPQPDATFYGKFASETAQIIQKIHPRPLCLALRWPRALLREEWLMCVRLWLQV